MKRIKVMSVVATMLLSAGVVYAGFRTAIEVEVTTDEAGNVTGAFGNLADTFNSADDVQFIGCGGSNRSGFCQAADASGTLQAFCFTQDQALIAHIHAIGPDSFVSFSLDPVTGDCLTVRVSTQSFYGPKVPDKHTGKAKGQEK